MNEAPCTKNQRRQNGCMSDDPDQFIFYPCQTCRFTESMTAKHSEVSKSDTSEVFMRVNSLNESDRVTGLHDNYIGLGTQYADT